jgi:hypothetical protein
LSAAAALVAHARSRCASRSSPYPRHAAANRARGKRFDAGYAMRGTPRDVSSPMGCSPLGIVKRHERGRADAAEPIVHRCRSRSARRKTASIRSSIADSV